jgi:hypothetical protein
MPPIGLRLCGRLDGSGEAGEGLGHAGIVAAVEEDLLRREIEIVAEGAARCGHLEPSVGPDAPPRSRLVAGKCNQDEGELIDDFHCPSPAAVPNADGTVDIYFGPEAPEGKASNWVQTMPGKGWFTILRFYNPLEGFFDKSWQVGEVELMS